MEEKKKLPIKYIRMFFVSVVTGFVFVVGKTVDEADTVYLGNVGMYIKFLAVMLISFGILAIFDFFYKKIKKGNREIKKIPEVSDYFVIAPIATWVAAWLAIWPGVFSYDCYEEWQMIANNTLTSHHPVLHVLVLGGLTQMSKTLFGNGNAGIAVYVVLQMALYAFVFIRLLDYLKRQNKRLAQWVALILYTFSPVVLMFVTATTKDSVFAAFEIWFIINCMRLEKEKGRLPSAYWAELTISALGTMIFRKNGLYIAVLALIYLFLRYCKKEKKIIITTVLVFAIYFIYAVPLFAVLHVGETSSAEMLAVPIQQMARVYRFNYESLSEEDKEVMFDAIPEEDWQKYIPSTADAVKNGFDNEAFSERKAELLKVWIEQGVKNPMTYLNAFLANTVDFWCPISVIDGYRWLYGMDENDNSSFFDYRVAPPGEKITLIKPVYDYFLFLSTDKKITTGVFSIFLSPGWYILAWIVSLLFYDKEKSGVFHVIMALSLLSVLLGPMGLVRYVLIFYLVLPLEIQ